MCAFAHKKFHFELKLACFARDLKALIIIFAKFAALDPFIIHTKPANNQIRIHTLKANLYANEKDFKQS